MRPVRRRRIGLAPRVRAVGNDGPRSHRASLQTPRFSNARFDWRSARRRERDVGDGREEPRQVVDRHRPGQEKALRDITTRLVQRTKRLAGLDALGDDAEAEVVPEVDDRAHDRGVARDSRACPCTKLMSILSSSIGSDVRYRSEVWPVPKSSRLTCTPNASSCEARSRPAPDRRAARSR